MKIYLVFADSYDGVFIYKSFRTKEMADIAADLLNIDDRNSLWYSVEELELIE